MTTHLHIRLIALLLLVVVVTTSSHVVDAPSFSEYWAPDSSRAAPPPVLLRIPLELDGVYHRFVLRAGEPPNVIARRIAARLPQLERQHLKTLRRTLGARLRFRGLTWQHKVSVLLLTAGDAAAAPALAASAAAHMIGPATELIVVTNGFSLCRRTQRDLARKLLRAALPAVHGADESFKESGSAGADAEVDERAGIAADADELQRLHSLRRLRRLAFLSFEREFVGYPLAINAALERVPPRAAVALLSPSFTLRPARAPGRMHRQHTPSASGNARVDVSGKHPGYVGAADVFVAFETRRQQLGRRTRLETPSTGERLPSIGSGDFLLTASPPALEHLPILNDSADPPSSLEAAEGWSRRAPLPLLMLTPSLGLDDDTNAASSFTREGMGVCVGPVPMHLMLQGAVALWVARARGAGCSFDDPSLASQFVRAPLQQHPQAAADHMSRASAQNARQLEAEAQRDYDAFALSLRPRLSPEVAAARRAHLARLVRHAHARPRAGVGVANATFSSPLATAVEAASHARLELATIPSWSRRVYSSVLGIPHAALRHAEERAAAVRAGSVAQAEDLESDSATVAATLQHEEHAANDEERSRVRAIAVVCVYDDARFLETVLSSVLPEIEHVLILISTVPWHGAARNNTDGARAVRRALHRLESGASAEALGAGGGGGGQSKLSVMSGGWRSEAEQREFGNAVAAAMPQNFTHAVIVDADEVWEQVELRRMLILASRTPEAPWLRAHMATYFRTSRAVVDPPEELRILWLVRLRPRSQMPHVIAAAGGREFYPIDNGKTIDLSVGKCHHLSYVRTTSELLGKKLVSFQHAEEVVQANLQNWVGRAWERWVLENGRTRNLHPTQPSAYASTVPQPLLALPPALRALFARHCAAAPVEHGGYLPRLASAMQKRAIAEATAGNETSENERTRHDALAAAFGTPFLGFAEAAEVRVSAGETQSEVLRMLCYAPEASPLGDEQHERSTSTSEVLGNVVDDVVDKPLERGATLTLEWHDTSAACRDVQADGGARAARTSLVCGALRVAARRGAGTRSCDPTHTGRNASPEDRVAARQAQGILEGAEDLLDDQVDGATVDTAHAPPTTMKDKDINARRRPLLELTAAMAQREAEEADRDAIFDRGEEIALTPVAQALTLPQGETRIPAGRGAGQAPPPDLVHCAKSRLGFVVVVVGEGAYDASTRGAFADVATTIRGGLRELGFVAPFRFCRDLRFCSLSELGLDGDTRQRVWIPLVLGAHNLAHYFDEAGELALLTRRLLPRGSVLYNLEFIRASAVELLKRQPTGKPEDEELLHGGSMATRTVLKIYNSSRFFLWEYSARNAALLRSANVRTAYVPLGYAAALSDIMRGERPPDWNWTSLESLGGADDDMGASCAAEGSRAARRAYAREAAGQAAMRHDIDVLFYGNLNGYRATILARLRAAGVRVVHANAERPIFGARLDRLIERAKIVLNLRYFVSDDEWKMTRLMRLLANQRFIISETSGDPAERARFDGGIVFAEADQLVRVVQYYLARPAERARIARVGYIIMRSVRAATALEPHVRELATLAGCKVHDA